MMPDEMDRTIRFIVETQAQTTANIQKHDEAIAALERNAARHDQDIKTVTDLIGRLAISMTELTGRMNSLAETHKETNERLNALILVVDKIIRARNGGSKV
ncbi:MAG TPA: hypothetical protein VG028_06450 [Terriglobia bacterium]|nr:hypothetical protein [Terriglobia bacterium]